MFLKKKLRRAYQTVTPDLMPSLMEHCPKPSEEPGEPVIVKKTSRLREFVATAAAITLVIGMSGGLAWFLLSGKVPDTQSSQSTQPTQTQHEHVYETQVVPPGQFTDGYTLHTCACGHSFCSDFVVHTGHDLVTFPLEEPVTFTLMVLTSYDEDDLQEMLESTALYQKLKEMTNVSIEIMCFEIDYNMDPTPKPYGDFYIGSSNGIPTNAAVLYMEDGFLQPITEYINPIYMPNLWADLMESPETLGMITAPDGEIYTLPRITGWAPQYLESPMWINKTWLDNLGLEVPTTLEELEHVLKEFAAKDANKNGDTTDEIPWLVSANHNNMHFEALYGLWGYGVKQGINDMYLQVIDGQVVFSATQPEWKEYLAWVKELYDAGVVREEAITGAYPITDIYNAADCTFGFCTNTNPPPKSNDEWIVLPPVSNGDYETRWFYNCAAWGTKGNFYVTDKCENVDILCAWMDLFYDLDNAYAVENHPDYYSVDENGNYIPFVGNLDTGKVRPSMSSITGGYWPRAYMPSDYDRLPGGDLIREEAYEAYAAVINTELWPRPYWDSEVAEEIGTLAPPIDRAVKAWRADFITGRMDLQEDWNDYLAELEELELSTYLRYAQQANDVVYDAIEWMK